MTEMNSMLTLNICNFCSHTKDWLWCQTVFADLLDLENLGSKQKGSVVAYDKYISSTDVLKERFHDPDL
jgi:hypothetical protein